MKTAAVLSVSAVLCLASVAPAQQAVAAAAPAAVAASEPPVKVGPDAAGKYMLREGEDVQLKFAQDISSKTAADGDPVAFILSDDLKVGNITVAKSGSTANIDIKEGTSLKAYVSDDVGLLPVAQ